MDLSPEQTIAGILAPLFALRGDNDLGVGDLGALREFIGWAAENGFALVQMLPINETGSDHSPYNAISSIALEPTTLELAPGSLPELTSRDFDEVVQQEDLGRLRRDSVDYEQVRKLKYSLLERAFESFRSNPDGERQRAFSEFCAREKQWLEPFAFFRALMELNGDRETWDEWQPEHRSPPSARDWLACQRLEMQDEFGAREQFFRYVQWIADEQWRAVSRFAEERGVALMGDIPFGVSYYSADVWADREIFHLDWSGGAPPEPYFKDDEFTMKWGQNWGIPVYNWQAMRADNFSWWRQRTRGVKRIFHVFRIDHVLGFYRIYAFPWRPRRNAEMLPLTQKQMLERTGGRAPHFMPRDDETPENCAANKRDGEEYLRVVLEESGATRVAGEDLGTVPKYVRPNLQALGIAGFKVPQWEVYGGAVARGDEYERLSVATYATHDHKPIRELWAEAHDSNSPTREQAAEDLRKIAQFASLEPREGLEYDRDFYPAIMRGLFQCNSWIAIVMITDLFARRDRFNVPGTAGEGNWTRRLPKSVRQMRASVSLRKRLKGVRSLLEQTGRIPPRMPTDSHG
ncbi:MAG: 4-alpha-glucanotransferase [Verrucomicrobia bacterium]|nr:4-alpha-glucanotransferase [Verrucomicrobiota bacterium]